MSMNKLSSDEVRETLAQVGPALRALSAERDALLEKVAQYEKRDRVEKLASAMQSKGLDTSTTHEEKVAALMKRDDLRVIEEAVNMSAPQIKLAELVSDHPGNPTSAESNFISSLLQQG